MGYVLLGMVAVTAAGMQGAAMQMFAHGISSAMLFLLVGVIYERAHHRDLAGFGGIGLQMPYYAGMATIGFFASLGLPGLCGFIGEALVFLGAFNSEVFGRIVVYIAVPTVVLTAAYILWTIQRVFLGPIKNEKYKTFKDMSFREWFALTPLAILAILVGVWPRAVLDIMNDSLNTIVEIVRTAL
jgi:NADH-quinone oxidoreductase subunit M